MSRPQGPAMEGGQRHAPKGRVGSAALNRAELWERSSRLFPSCATGFVLLPTRPRSAPLAEQMRLLVSIDRSNGSSGCHPDPAHPWMRGSSHGGTPFQVLQPVAATSLSLRRVDGRMQMRPPRCHHDTTWWRPSARADGGEVSRSRATQCASRRGRCVGVHAFTAGNVRARDPGRFRVKPPLLNRAR